MPRNRKLIVDELITKPSAVSPTLFVGLGGCGCQIVARVAEHLTRRPDFAERYRELVKFVLVDTNINDLEAHREIAHETFLISDFEKEQYANLAAGKLFLEEDPYFTQWVPQDYRFRAGDTAGAGQIRIESRLGIYYQMKHKDLVPRMRKVLEELKSHEHGHRRLDTQEIRIVLCYSIAGGTGSGSHLPLAYTLRDLASELGKPWLVGVAVLPSVFEDRTGINKDGTFANGYAALKETEFLMKLGAPDSRFYRQGGVDFHYNPADESKKTVRDRPFEFVYLIDKPESFSVSDPVAAAADGLYLQFFSPLYASQASDYDNYTQHQRFLVPHDFEAKGIQGFTSFYGSYGAAVMLVPVPGLVDYCSQASALSLMRENFLRDIPSEPVYASLRLRREDFDQVTIEDDSTERPIPRAEFHKREPAVRERLQDRLYMKRVRLLAACEHQRGEQGRFLSLFRHGHRLGEVPKADGSFDFQQDRIAEDRRNLADLGMKHSINALVLPGLAGSRPGEDPGLLKAARTKIDQLLDEDPPTVSGDTDASALLNRAAMAMDDFREAGKRVLNDGYREGTLSYPGLDSLVELDFLKEEAGEVDLAAKRYAVLRLLEEIRWDALPPEPPGELDAGGQTGRVRAAAAPALLASLIDQAADHAMIELRRHFLERLGDLRQSLKRFTDVQRVLDHGFGDLEREQAKRLERIRVEGEDSTDQYILDVEALRTEDGRRLWDFFYEHRVAPLPELSLKNEEIQQVLADTVTDFTAAGVGSTSAILEKLFRALRTKAKQYIEPRIAGDAKASDRESREGLTLAEALELEVLYRALLLSDAERITREGQRAIREIVAEYEATPAEERQNLTEPRYQDYLRDKLKRAVKEKASLLCVYDESRDQHGGVRPDHVLLAAIDEDFKNSTIEETLRNADIPNLKWVTTGWHNPKEIIFYRAILNVPLYVFGRLKDMKHHYERFRNLAKRSKTLHIDKNWEEKLPDLDPDSAQEVHRQTLVRDQIINFAALLTLPRTSDGPAAGAAPAAKNRGRGSRAGNGPSYILRRNGCYYLTEPAHPPGDGRGKQADDGLARLDDSLSGAIRKLPDVFAAERVKYLPYQQVLKMVRQGLMPQVLRGIAKLPFDWRRSYEELHNQYGSRPNPDQQRKLDDYEDAFQRLRESLEDLLERLRNREIEQRTLGEDAGASSRDLDPGDARRNLQQSVEILRAFADTWRQMENPEETREIPSSFHHLFKPLTEEELHELLEQLHSAFGLGTPPAANVA